MASGERKLVSKIQFRIFEPGEFAEEKLRSLAETIDIIARFPWQQQRDQNMVGLTNPSVTIEGPNSDFLKLALYYNGKFVLHYLDKENHLFDLTLSNPESSRAYLERLFDNPQFVPDEFTKQRFRFDNKKKHFQSQDFHYIRTKSAAWKYRLTFAFYSVAIIYIFLFAAFFSAKFYNTPKQIGLMIFIILPVLVSFVMSFALIKSIRYFWYSANKVLIMSRGNEIFYFGDQSNPQQYSKKDIDRVTIARLGGNRADSGFCVTFIDFNNSLCIAVPNIIIDYSALQNKLTGHPVIFRDGFFTTMRITLRNH